MQSVLLTRARENNYEIIEEIKKCSNGDLNFNYIHCPLIEYHNLIFNSEILSNYSNIIITSKHAVKLLISQAQKHIPGDIWVIGDSSKTILEDHGLKVVYAGKNVSDIIAHFPANLYTKAIYLSASEITQDLPSQIKRKIIYNVKYLNKLPNIEQFKVNISYILLYSHNSAKTLVKLLLQNNLFEFLQNSTVIAISLRVANIIRPFIKNVLYCDNDNPRLMIKLLIDHAKARR
jgi:uroporphyrinogen-III synthase